MARRCELTARRVVTHRHDRDLVPRVLALKLLDAPHCPFEVRTARRGDESHQLSAGETCGSGGTRSGGAP